MVRATLLVLASYPWCPYTDHGRKPAAIGATGYWTSGAGRFQRSGPGVRTTSGVVRKTIVPSAVGMSMRTATSCRVPRPLPSGSPIPSAVIGPVFSLNPRLVFFSRNVVMGALLPGVYFQLEV